MNREEFNLKMGEISLKEADYYGKRQVKNMVETTIAISSGEDGTERKYIIDNLLQLSNQLKDECKRVRNEQACLFDKPGEINLIVAIEEMGELAKEIAAYLDGNSNHDGLVEKLADVSLGTPFIKEICRISEEELKKAMAVKVERQNRRTIAKLIDGKTLYDDKMLEGLYFKVDLCKLVSSLSPEISNKRNTKYGYLEKGKDGVLRLNTPYENQILSDKSIVTIKRFNRLHFSIVRIDEKGESGLLSRDEVKRLL